MNADALSLYRHPATHAPLTLVDPVSVDGAIVSGALRAPDGTTFPIRDGIADLVWPRDLTGSERAVVDFYDGRADVYDRYLPLTFTTHGEDEATVRASMVDLLRLTPGATVLEVGAGTGRDSRIIAERLAGSGRFFCQDLTGSMLARNRDQLKAAGLDAEFGLSNGSHLPFADDTFDALYQFGGVGEFPDIAAFFREAVRVVKPGGRIVAGDESMPPWLRKTEFARVLTFTNPQFDAALPLEHLPVEAREVCLRWLIGGTFYLIDFTVGVGEPKADIDFPIPGVRGGSHRTRVYGQLEGVSLETKALALEARAKLGLSMHDWLDALVRREAEAILARRGLDGGG